MNIEENIVSERYYTRFCEKGYIVRDSFNNHKIVYKGTHVNGNDAKKWACEQNNKLLKNETLSHSN